MEITSITTFLIAFKMKDISNAGVVKAVSLVLHGTKEMPAHVKASGGRRKYDPKYNNVQNTRDVS